MLRLRIKTIEKILEASKPDLVRNIVLLTLNEETNIYNPSFQPSQFMHNLKSDVLFQLMSKQDYKEFKNLKEALSVIQEHTDVILGEDSIN